MEATQRARPKRNSGEDAGPLNEERYEDEPMSVVWKV